MRRSPGPLGSRRLKAWKNCSRQKLMRSILPRLCIVHCEQVARCVRAGKHVLCEKPLALSVAEGQEVVALAKRCKVQLGVGFMMRFHSQHQEALKIIQSGKLGRPVYGRAQLSCWYPPLEGAWRQDPSQGGGGSLADMGVHCIDLLEMFFGPWSRSVAGLAI